jgi:hypothetical protein
VAFAVLGTAGLGTASAQELAAGAWPATLTAPGGQTIDVSLEVSGTGEDLAILWMWPEGSPMAAENMQLEGVALSEEGLTFVLPIPNVHVVCNLEGNDDGSYEGACDGDDGESGHLHMVPPA